MPPSLVIVKVGGSLLGVPGLGRYLARYVEEEWAGGVGAGGAVLVPGGGPTADVIRRVDRCQGLGEEKAHWLALRALSLNAHVLASLLPSAAVLEDIRDCQQVFRQGKVPVLDMLPFCRQDEGRPGALPHLWDVTSDSLAARVAVAAGATCLVLLKSAALPAGVDWEEAGRQGFVDPFFAEVMRQPSQLGRVEAINFRAWIDAHGAAPGR